MSLALMGSRAQPTKAWTPRELSTLSLWLDADDATTITSSTGVSQWSDKSGNGKHATQATGSKQPLYVTNSRNGRSVLRFDGTDDELNVPSLGLTTAPWSIALAFKFNRSAGQVLVKSNAAGIKLSMEGSNIRTDAGVQADWAGANTNWHTLIWTVNGANSLTSYDGTATTRNTGSNVLTSFDLGSDAGAYFSQVDIGEVVVLNKALSTGDRQRLEGYLSHKWALGSTLPANHPYKTSAPALIDNGSGVSATGGIVTFKDGYKIHSFTTVGTSTLNVAKGGNVEVLVVGGGGGGGGRARGGGGGGAGGVQYSASTNITTGAVTVIVGAGGTGGNVGVQATSGSSSSFGPYLSASGGGRGGGNLGSPSFSWVGPQNGGSGGGGTHDGTTAGASGISGQGNSGGNGSASSSGSFFASGGGGGGGASQAGSNAITTASPRTASGGNGGNGVAYSISGSSVTYGGGGGAGCQNTESGTCTNGTGGTGGGGSASSVAAASGSANTGGGGAGSSGTVQVGGNGGSGIVIVRYPSSEGTWTPRNLNALSLWLDADDASTITVATGISQWADKSGNGLHFIQDTGANQPTLVSNSINGRSAVDFNGTAHQMQGNANYQLFATSSSPVTLFSVVRLDNVSTQRAWFAWDAGDPVFEIHTGLASNSGAVSLHRSNSNAAITANSTVNTGMTYIISHELLATGNSPSNVVIRVNGLSMAVSNLGSGYANAGAYQTASTQPLTLGARRSPAGSWSNNMDGRIAEIVLIRASVSQTERRYVEGYLAHKWGTTESLPNWHPYKYIAP